jgi:hypothetical protein
MLYESYILYCIPTRCPGWFGPEDNPSRRLVWPAIYVREPGDDNMYVLHADTAIYYTIFINMHSCTLSIEVQISTAR